MTEIPLLQNGCNAGDIIDTINAIIARLNDGGGQSISYNDLTDKPSINGVELSGNQTTRTLLVALGDATDYDALIATLASKTYADSAKAEAVAAAQSAVNAALDGKLDKDLGNIETVSSLSDKDYVLIFTSNGLRIARVDRLSDNVAVRTVSTRVVESSINSQLKKLTVAGAQDGENVDYTVAEAYVAGTQMLFFNGQLLTHNTDYKVSAAGFTMLTYIPESEDDLTFIGVPK